MIDVDWDPLVYWVEKWRRTRLSIDDWQWEREKEKEENETWLHWSE